MFAIYYNRHAKRVTAMFHYFAKKLFTLFNKVLLKVCLCVSPSCIFFVWFICTNIELFKSRSIILENYTTPCLLYETLYIFPNSEFIYNKCKEFRLQTR